MFPPMLNRFHRLSIAIVSTLAAMAGIFAMSARQRVPVPPGFSAKVISTLGHFSVYLVLAVLLYWTLSFVMDGGWRRYVTAWTLAVLYGLSDEWHQSFVPGRTPDVVDIVTDGIGAAVGLLIVWWITRRVGRGTVDHQRSGANLANF
jgi:VanZ family protein